MTPKRLSARSQFIIPQFLSTATKKQTTAPQGSQSYKFVEPNAVLIPWLTRYSVTDRLNSRATHTFFPLGPRRNGDSQISIASPALGTKSLASTDIATSLIANGLVTMMIATSHLGMAESPSSSSKLSTKSTRIIQDRHTDEHSSAMSHLCTCDWPTGRSITSTFRETTVRSLARTYLCSVSSGSSHPASSPSS
jgi:hypothetical protein